MKKMKGNKLKMSKKNKIAYLILILVLLLSCGCIPEVECEENNKYKIITEEEFQDRLERGDYDFSWCVFPFKVDLSGLTLTDADFSNAIFENNMDFSNAVFKGDRTDFINTEFNRTANFNNAHFEEFVCFGNTIFYSNASFNKTNFGRTAFAQFGDEEYKEQEEMFQGRAGFDHAIFEKEAYFQNVTFKKDVSFTLTTFKDQITFRSVKFESNTYFERAVFESEVLFQGTIFGKEEKMDRTDFIITTFYNQANFISCTFNIETNFGSVQFKSDTYFTKTVFKGEVNFVHSKFYKEVNFNDVIFKKSTNFIFMSFEGSTYFSKTIFGDDLGFPGTEFKQIFILDPEKNNEIDLRYLKCFGNGKIMANLTQAQFKDIYFIDNINFEGSNWPEDYIIYEESHRKDLGLNYKDLETIYRNLKKSFESHGNEEYAGKAFYREMEMRRLDAIEEGNWKQRAWLYFLKKICGYGERPENIVFWSFVVIFGFAGLFYKSGINIENHRRYFLSFWNKIRYSGFCLLFSITSFSTLGAKYIKPRGNASRWLSAIESLIGMFFIALFIYIFVRKMLR